jgi:hypothetical protein
MVATIDPVSPMGPEEVCDYVEDYLCGTLRALEEPQCQGHRCPLPASVRANWVLLGPRVEGQNGLLWTVTCRWIPCCSNNACAISIRRRFQ